MAEDISSKFGGFMSKTKALALAGIMGLTGAAQEAYAQVILSFSGPTNVTVGVPIQYNLLIDTHTNSNVQANQIGSVGWQLNLSNSSNATINSVSSPAVGPSDAFNSFATTTSYNPVLGSSNHRDVTGATGPSNIPSLNYATVTVTFNQPGNYTFSYGGTNPVVDTTPNILAVNSSATLGVTASAIPESSTYAAIAGLGALGVAAAMRRRKEGLAGKVNGK